MKLQMYQKHAVFCTETIVEFTEDSFKVTETEGKVEIPVIRRGDVSGETKVYITTKSGTAESPGDFTEKTKIMESIVVFEPGV